MYIDEYGRRRDFNVTILNFRQSSMIQTGYWDTFNGIHVKQIKKEKDIYIYRRFIEEKIFKISVHKVRNTILHINYSFTY